MASDLISRKALLQKFAKSTWHDGRTFNEEGYFVRAYDVHNMIDKAPAVDAVEVVRCKDCKYFKFGDYCYHDGAMEHSHARENDFCSYGIRRKKKDAVD